MTTVGSLAYSIVANTQQFTAGVAASKAELRTLKDAFLSSQTPVERFSQAIDHLQQLAQKFPEKAAGINRTIAQMRTEMTAGSATTAHAAHGTDEFTHAMDRMNTRMGRMMLAEVMGTLHQIPGALLAIEIGFGNWLGAAIHGMMLAHELIEETNEAVTKTADLYESATDKAVKFYEEESRAREKGRARDRVGGLPGEVEKGVVELGMGQMGYSASNTFSGKGERVANWLQELQLSIMGMSPEKSTKEEAAELGKKQIQQEMESRRLAEDFTKSRGQFFDDFIRDFDKAVSEISRESDRWLGEFWRDFEKAGEQAEKTRIDAINRANDLAGKAYDSNEKKAEDIARSQMNGAEKLRDEFTKLQELQAGGFFDLHPGAYDKALQDIKDKASDLRGDDTFKGITTAVHSASAEGIAARFGTQQTPERQLREQQKANLLHGEANKLLGEIKGVIAAQAAMGGVP